jgi:lincosamide and streptogramin A transport system ATP-binding/permease protein
MRGNFSTWHENKLLTDSFELSENEKLSKEILRLEKSAKRASKWSERAEKEKIGFDPRKTEKSIGRRSFEGAKSKKLMKSSKAFLNRKNKAIEERSVLLKNMERADGLKISQLEHHRETLICLKNVTIRYGNIIGCEDVSFTLNKGDRIALTGKNGSGKSSVISLICGNKLDYEGRIEIASGLKISFVSQDTSFLKGNLSDLAKQAEIDESLLKAILNKFAFDKDMFDKDISDYSEGQKKKVLIARSLCEKAHVHIWDEPLNFIDILSRIQIEELILEYRPTMLFVEHDEAFCNRTATKKISL